jgi:glutamate dehydrogenase
MPILESFGLKVLQEQAFALLHEENCLWMHDFRTELPDLCLKSLLYKP